MSCHTPGPWVIDDRSHYAEPAGGHQAPSQLGVVVAECPTAFGGHTVRAPGTIGKPCPTKAELDAAGLANAHLCKAGPDLLAACVRATDALLSLAFSGLSQTDASEVALKVLYDAIARAKGAE